MKKRVNKPRFQLINLAKRTNPITVNYCRFRRREKEGDERTGEDRRREEKRERALAIDMDCLNKRLA